MAFVSVGKKIMIRSLQRRNERGFFRKRGELLACFNNFPARLFFSNKFTRFIRVGNSACHWTMESESGTGWFKICICKFVHVKDRLRFRVNLENGRNIPCNKYGTKLERETCLVLEFFQLLGES